MVQRLLLEGESVKNIAKTMNTHPSTIYRRDRLLRQNRRRGWLKGEQLHQLARNVAYGKRGRITARALQEQRNTCSCLTLIIASIIYWQAKEITRTIEMHGRELNEACLKMLPHRALLVGII